MKLFKAVVNEALRVGLGQLSQSQCVCVCVCVYGTVMGSPSDSTFFIFAFHT